MTRRLTAILSLVIGALLVVPAAQADTGEIIESQHEPPTAEDGFQAGTCTTDTPECSPETPAQFYKQAGGHPPIGFTQYIVKQVEFEAGKKIPVGEVREVRVDLPAGESVNPEATGTRCTMEQFKERTGPAEGELPKCPPTSLVGEQLVTLKVVAGPGKGTAVAPIAGVTKVPVYNLVPEFGEPALFGFDIGAPGSKHDVFLKTDVAWESDYHQGFTIEIPPASPGTLTWKSRLRNFGRAGEAPVPGGDGTFITNPTTCFEPSAYTTFLRAQPAGNTESVFVATPWAAKLPAGTNIEGCELVPFTPTIKVEPGATEVDSPSGPNVYTEIPWVTGGANIVQSHLRNATVTLPQGVGINPSAANGLQACTDAQFGKGTRNPVACPAASKVGTVEIETSALPPGSLRGDMFIGQQLSRNPQSGEEFRLFVDAESARYGVSVRLIGNTAADPVTGQLTTTFRENPQQPFESIALKFDPAKGVLSSPPVCGPVTATSTFEPWSTPAATKHPTASFEVGKAPGGGTCPTSMAARPFTPTYTAKSDNTRASKFFPFRITIARNDGEQELKVADVTLPKGLAAKLRGVAYCSETGIQQSISASGAEELSNPGCGAGSLIATSTTKAGTGPNPLTIKGKVYLAGPYKGAPLSLVVVTPAVAGPFDLGTVVVRVALEVDPVTTQVTAKSDVIPDVYGGVKLDIRSLAIDVDRPEFMHNPSNCAQQSVLATLKGGGANPADPSTFSSYPLSIPYQATECDALGFQPRLQVRLLGGKKATRRRQHPGIKATLKGRTVKDANVAFTSLTLPRSMLLDNAHIKTICTRVQLAAHQCPKASIYGKAAAESPLIEGPLRGPVYLVSSSHKLPDLVADLQGQVEIQLHGVISTVKGRMKTTFNMVPDQPVTRFTLTMHSGAKGLVVNSTDVCKNKGSRRAKLVMKGQNGKKKVDKHLALITSCGKKKKH